ncbi:MAG: insulinase family protein [Saprospiraceae bacterium]|nr:insulinase family protein [Saprospiraceae bacterium]
MKNLISIRKSVILSLFLSFAGALSAQLPANIEKLTSVEGITEYRLKNNGLRVLIFPDASKQTATVNLTFLVGSRHEGYGETGMAHLLEHLVFKGSPKHKDIPAEFKARGAQWNGTTWVDRTNYFETFPANDENLEWALDLESDRMVNSFIAKKDLESEFTVVRNEFESGENDPTGVLMERVLSSAYLWHNYGKSTIGNRADIENVPIENLQAFYRKFYQPDNAVLTVAGKIDEKKTLALIDKYFSPVPKPTRVLPNTWSTEPTQDGERNVILRRVGDVQVTSAGYHVPAGSHPDFAAVQIVTDALTDNPSGRLYKNLIAANKAASTWSFAFQTKEPGFVYFNVDVRKEQNLDEAKNIFLKTLDDLATNPLTEEEVKRAKQQNLKQLEEAYRNTARTGVLLSEFIALGDWRMFFITRDNLEKITAKDVERVAKAYFKPSNRTVGVFIPDAKPDRAEIPPTPEVSALVEGYKGKAQMAEGEVFDPSIFNVDARTKTGKAGAVKYAFLSKKTRGNTVVANMTLRVGDAKSLEGKRMVSYLTGRMLRKGTAKHTAQQLNDELDALKATVNISGSQDKINVSIETVRDNLPRTLELVNEMLKESTIPEKEFNEIIQQELAACEQQLSDPQYLAQNAMQKHVSPYAKNDVRYTASPQEEIDELKTAKAEEARKFYKEFYGASDATVSIVGDFDEETAKKIITEGIGSWKSPKPYKRLESKHFDVPAKNDVIKTPDKANAMFMAALNIAMKDDDPDFPAMVLGNVVLGGGGLSSRLANRIRQKEGISYGVGSGFQADPLDKTGGLFAYAIYAPENLERLEKAFKEEVDKLLKDGITEEELATAKKYIMQNRLVGRSNDKQLSGKLNGYQFLGRDMKWDAAYEEKLSKITADEVNKALKKHVDASKISMFKAGDFDKVKKP